MEKQTELDYFDEKKLMIAKLLRRKRYMLL